MKEREHFEIKRAGLSFTTLLLALMCLIFGVYILCFSDASNGFVLFFALIMLLMGFINIRDLFIFFGEPMVLIHVDAEKITITRKVREAIVVPFNEILIVEAIEPKHGQEFSETVRRGILRIHTAKQTYTITCVANPGAMREKMYPRYEENTGFKNIITRKDKEFDKCLNELNNKDELDHSNPFNLGATEY